MKEFTRYLVEAILKVEIIHKDNNQKDLKIIFTNDQIEKITKLKKEDIIGRKLTDLYPKLTSSLFDWPKIFIEAAMTDEHKVIEQYFEEFEKYLRFVVFGYNNDMFYISLLDVTEKKEFKKILIEKQRQINHLENELKLRANMDSLTHIYNFQFILECLENSIENYNSSSVNFCMLLLKIDDFKKINIKMGINFGDKILYDFAQLIRTVVRRIDIIGKYENDAYVIIFNNLDIDIAKIMAEKIKMQTTYYNNENNNNQISYCGALVEYSGEPIDIFFDKAEKLLVKAQSKGKGIVLS